MKHHFNTTTSAADIIEGREDWKKTNAARDVFEYSNSESQKIVASTFDIEPFNSTYPESALPFKSGAIDDVDWYNLLEYLCDHEAWVKQYLCVWGAGYTGSLAMQDTHELAWFTGGLGYSPEDIEKISNLRLGESLNIIGLMEIHSVTRLS